MTGRIVKRDDDKFEIFGWASVAGVEDSQGDVIPIEELEKAAYNFVLSGGFGSEMHSSRTVASLIESMIFTDEKLSALGIEKGNVPLGWWVGFKVHDAAVWQKIKNGDYTMFSIGGRAIREEKSDE